MGALGLRLKVKRVAKRAKIKRNVYPHMLRHSAATELAKYMTDSEMKRRFGWQRRETVDVYEHIRMRDVDNHYLKLKGKRMEEERREPEIKVVECLRCGNENDGADLYCGKCGLVLDRAKALALEGFGLSEGRK